ncbi:MAG: sodium/proton-translocating pyrophosphatase, partial [Gammaproteobacteria bacterium]|nr:sodium/proton-translocating pyrophosphatase [Gammaproteobacteria bacterium]
MSVLPIILGIVGLLYAYYIFGKVKQYPEGNERVRAIGDQIHLGAMVFMRTEYRFLLWFCIVVGLLVAFGVSGWTALAFVIGACCSAAAGWIGMSTATRANVRTTTAAAERGAAEALTVAFFGGSIMGLAVASLGLLGLGVLYAIFGGDPATAETIHGFGMGASSVALFSRVGGGIFTKSADVGADLVGKVEAG